MSSNISPVLIVTISLICVKFVNSLPFFLTSTFVSFAFVVKNITPNLVGSATNLYFILLTVGVVITMLKELPLPAVLKIPLPTAEPSMFTNSICACGKCVETVYVLSLKKNNVGNLPPTLVTLPLETSAVGCVLTASVPLSWNIL